MATTIHNLNMEKMKDGDIYIGRGSKYGNPFKIGEDGKREEVIEKYREWILEPEQKHIIDSLIDLKDKRLFCYCWPNHCHGHVLIDLIEEKYGI